MENGFLEHEHVSLVKDILHAPKLHLIKNKLRRANEVSATILHGIGGTNMFNAKNRILINVAKIILKKSLETIVHFAHLDDFFSDKKLSHIVEKRSTSRKSSIHSLGGSEIEEEENTKYSDVSSI